MIKIAPKINFSEGDCVREAWNSPVFPAENSACAVVL